MGHTPIDLSQFPLKADPSASFIILHSAESVSRPLHGGFDHAFIERFSDSFEKGIVQDFLPYLGAVTTDLCSAFVVVHTTVKLRAAPAMSARHCDK